MFKKIIEISETKYKAPWRQIKYKRNCRLLTSFYKKNKMKIMPPKAKNNLLKPHNLLIPTGTIIKHITEHTYLFIN